MSKEKHGLIGSVIKVLMAIVFTVIGAAILSLGAYCWAKGLDIGKTEAGEAYNVRWLSICNVVFGACLLTSLFFLSKNRGGLNKIIKWVMAFAFTLIGIALIVGGAIPLAKHNYEDKYKWILICNVTFGALLVTAPFYLKKEVMGKEEKK